MTKRFGFTLAEVLITLSIIGIVASITIPRLKNHIEQIEQKAAFKKAYSTASQAWSQAVAENPSTYMDKGGWTNCPWPDGTAGDVNAHDGRADAFKSKMKVVKTCTNTTGCWPDDYEFVTWLTGNVKTGNYSPYTYSWMTADGMCWSNPYKFLPDDAFLLLDTNCNKKPNKVGQDIFSMILGADGVIYFNLDDKTASGRPISKGNVCPYTTDPMTINGRSVSFKSWLMN